MVDDALAKFLSEAVSLGVELSKEQTEAIQVVNPDGKMLLTALSMHGTAPVVLENVLDQIVRTAKANSKTNPPAKAGGDKPMVKTPPARKSNPSLTPEDTKTLEALLAKAKAAEQTPTPEPDDEDEPEGPQPLTLQELESLLPAATKEATTFEAADAWNPEVGDAIMVRLKRVHKGVYATPLVIAKEWATYSEDKKLGPVKTEDLKLPGWAIRRAQERNVKLVEGLVYFVKFVGLKETQYKDNDFHQAVVLGPFADFPKSR